MKTWKVRMRAIIDDTYEVEAETEEEAIENANSDWRFAEASQWESEAEEVEEGA